MKIKLINLLFFSYITITSQTFTHSLSITAKQDGMQALAISPELKNIANTGFNDVRIFDISKNEIPYFFVNESFNYSSVNFKEYEVIDKAVGKGRFTSLVITNTQKKSIQNIVLCTVNSDAVKFCNIVGSDDKKQWFSVSDHILLYNLYDDKSVNVYRTLVFPPVNYKFIKIEINDLGTLPLNVLKAGYFEGAISAGRMNLVEPVVFDYSTNKEKKTSNGIIKFLDKTIINRITFKIKSPNFYKRQAKIIVERSRMVKHQEQYYKETVLEFELNSNGNNSFDLSSFREKEFKIEISNEDNPPLVFEKVEFGQLQSYLVSDFKKGAQYFLFAGNKTLNSPVYDIENFKNNITQFVPTLEVSQLKQIPVVELKPIIEDKKIWQEPWFMWVCIALASFLLFLFSLRILKDMKK